MRTTLSAPIVCTALLLALVGQAAAYVPAELDRGFGNRGVIVSASSNLRIATRHNLVRADSEALTGVNRTLQSVGGCTYDTRLNRFRLSDGALLGSQAFPVAPPCLEPIPAAVAIGRDAAERVYMALAGDSSIHLTRLLRDGTPDPAFGLAGAVVLPTSRPVAPELLRVGTDESVLIAGVATSAAGTRPTETFLARVAGDGFDPAFGEGGIRFFDLGPGETAPQPSALDVATDGGIYLAGPLFRTGAKRQLAPAGVRAFLPDGTTDRRFGKGGFARLSGSAVPAMVFSKQRILAVVNRPGKPSQVIRLTEAGKLDKRFGERGVVTLPAGRRFAIAEIAVDGNDRIALAGTLRNHIAVDRLTADGSQDRTFAGGGIFNLDAAARVPSGAPTVEGLALGSGNAGGGIAVTALVRAQARRWDVRFRLEGQTSHEHCGFRRATIVGTSRSERLVGTRGTDTIAALGGDDTILGRGGNDLICGGQGRDTIRPGPGRDQVFR